MSMEVDYVDIPLVYTLVLGSGLPLRTEVVEIKIPRFVQLPERGKGSRLYSPTRSTGGPKESPDT